MLNRHRATEHGGCGVDLHRCEQCFSTGYNRNLAVGRCFAHQAVEEGATVLSHDHDNGERTSFRQAAWLDEDGVAVMYERLHACSASDESYCKTFHEQTGGEP